MAYAFARWMTRILLSVTAVAAATASALSGSPVLPGSSVATDAVRDALRPEAPAAQAAPAPQAAAQLRAAAVSSATAAAKATSSEPLAVSPIRGKTAIVRATAYNSLPNQTDSTPFITATGTRTRPGVVALSRDLLRTFPYGTKIMIEDLSGRYNNVLKGQVFIVEDTMAARKTNSLDIWMATRSDAMRFGARQIRITAVR